MEFGKEYIKKFDTQAEYETFKNSSGYNTPNVSLIGDDNVIYNPYGHDYVEIGGIKWATMNIGANSITDYGLYFQWGDTQGYTLSQVGSGSGKKYFGWADYKYGDGTSNPSMTKYNSTDKKKTLDLEDDGVNAAWGGNWRMPTTAESQSLISNTTSAWTNNYEGSGVKGVILTDKTDSSKKLFLPASGRVYDGSTNNVGSSAYFYTSTLSVDNIQYGYDTSGSSGALKANNGRKRYWGNVLRGILDE